MSIARLLAEAEQEGRHAAEAFRRDPASARHLELGAFSSHGARRDLVLRRVLLACRVPPRLVGWLRAMTHRSGPPSRLGFLRQYAYWTGVKAGLSDGEIWRRLSRGPIVLMYHAIGARKEDPSCYVVPDRRFRLQMMWLRLCRYHVLSLSELVDGLRNGRLPPARAVVVTFDDGYADNHQLAFPTLRRFRIPATLFLVSRVIGGEASWTSEPTLRGRPLLDKNSIEEMLAAGIEVGAHTRTHVSLLDTPPGRARDEEIAGARADLERTFRQTVRVFAYPFGDFDQRIADEVRQAGYEAACCSRSGVNDPATPLFELRRVEVRGTDSFLRFALMVSSGRRGRRRAAGPVTPREAQTQPKARNLSCSP